MLRADFITLVQLLAHRVEHEVGLPAEEAHAEAVERIDVFVAVEVPDVRALRTVDDDLVDDFLELRTEAVDHARIGEVRPVLGGVLLRCLGARDVAAHESAEARLLSLGQFAGRLGVDAGDRAERLLHVVGFLAAVFFGRRRLAAAARQPGRLPARRRGAVHGSPRSSAICAASNCICCSMKVCSSAGEAPVAGSAPGVGLGLGRGRRHRSSRSRIGRHGSVEVLGERAQRGVALHQLAERDLDAESFLQLQCHLGQRQRVEAEFDEGRGRIGAFHVDSDDLVDDAAQPGDQLVAAGGLGQGLRHGHFGSGLPLQQRRNG